MDAHVLRPLPGPLAGTRPCTMQPQFLSPLHMAVQGLRRLLELVHTYKKQPLTQKTVARGQHRACLSYRFLCSLTLTHHSKQWTEDSRGG